MVVTFVGSKIGSGNRALNLNHGEQYIKPFIRSSSLFRNILALDGFTAALLRQQLSQAEHLGDSIGQLGLYLFADVSLS